ncbi:MAG: aconitate hydratase [Phycisphaerales bacterium]|jgi:aconitate hydratase|nr:aconitate hydratase [Phycisphaerales bacterium]
MTDAPKTLVEKILREHLVDGDYAVGNEIGIRIDQTLTQDATGTTSYLLLEAMDIPRVKTEASVSYVDHNMAQFGPENHNDHLYLQSVAAAKGVSFSRPGNGICHQVHLERFGAPGKTLLGSDSHTPTGGGMGMIAMGAGGLDVAVAMGGGAFYLTCPQVIGVELKGALQPWVAPKDIILKLLSVLTTRGNVGCMVEYFGDGLASLPAPARATVTNMGAELGVTTSVFPADEQTRAFLAAQGREDSFRSLTADAGASYGPITKKLHVETDATTIANIQECCTDVTIGEANADGIVAVTFGHVVIDLDALAPLAAGSPSPDNVRELSEIAGKKVSQVLIGSCTNSSFQDLMIVAETLRGRTVHPTVELGIAPGSKQVLTMLSNNGALAALVGAGARILESACGPCIGQGFSPAENTVSLRTVNRNFASRTGTTGDMVYLVSPEMAVAAALTGEVTDPRTLGIDCPNIPLPAAFDIDDNMLDAPLDETAAAQVEIIRGSTIVKPPAGDVLPDTLTGEVALHCGDKITTDHIMPAGALLKYRSNVPEYAKSVFNCFDAEGQPTFAERCLALKADGKASIIVAGDSYGQGSSREHAALCPMYLGVRVVIAKAIERIHQANLVNFAILPLTFASAADYDAIEQTDQLEIAGLAAAIASGETVTVQNKTKGTSFECIVNLAPRQREILTAGGLLNYTKQNA